MRLILFSLFILFSSCRENKVCKKHPRPSNPVEVVSEQTTDWRNSIFFKNGFFKTQTRLAGNYFLGINEKALMFDSSRRSQNSIRFEIDTIKGINCSTKQLDIYPFRGRRANRFSTTDTVHGQHISYSGLVFFNSKVDIGCDTFVLKGCSFSGNTCLSGSCNALIIIGCKFDILDCKNLHAARDVIIEATEFNSDINLSIPHNTQLDFVKGTGIINLQPYFFRDKTSNIDLNECHFGQLKFQDFNIHFSIDTVQSFSTQVASLRQVIDRFRAAGYDAMEYDIQLKKLINKHDNKWFVGFIDENWSNFGYNKTLIFGNSILIMLIFFLINLIVLRYPMVLYNGYVIDEFITADQRVTEKYEDSLLKQYFFRTIYCFIYTGYIFWGIKLKLENIKLSNVSLALWIIFQYIVGIICLAYIANIIITRV